MARNVYDEWNADETLPQIEPCPFCGGKGILCDNSWESPEIDESGAYVGMDMHGGDVLWCECESCGVMFPGEDTPESAIEQWNRRCKSPNEPLALEELREMDGEPVWLKIAGGVWGLVDGDDNTVWLDRGGSIEIAKLTGLAYRRSLELPEKGEENA